MIKSWNEVSVGKFLELNRLNAYGYEEDEYILRAAALMAGITYDEIMEKPLEETTELIKNVAFLYTAPQELKRKKEYVINGVTYVPLNAFDDMTTAQYIDFQAISQVCNEMLGEFLAIFLIPKGKKYNTDYKSSDVAKDIYEYLSVEEALALARFFTKQYSKSTKKMLLYSEAEMRTLRILTRDKEKKELLRKTEEVLKKARQMVVSMCG